MTTDTATSGTSENRLHGSTLMIARVVWLVVAALGLYVFGAGLPAVFAQALRITPETRRALALVGLSERFPAFFFLAVDILTMAVFSVIALLLFWRRSNDRMALFVALMLFLMGLNYTAPATEARVGALLVGSLLALGETSQITFLYLFPSGRFIPWWSKWLVAPVFLWRFIQWGLEYVPMTQMTPGSAENYGAVQQGALDLLGVIALLVIGIGVQIYRYRHRSNRLQRQQAKWLVLGSMITLAIAGPYILAVNGLQILADPTRAPFFLLVAGRSVRQAALLAIPMTIAVSILRYRLFDIDVALNRALVYGVVTSALTLVYFASVVILQRIFVTVTGERSGLAVVASTLALAAVAQPLRRQTQGLIDRRFYRSKYDAERTLQAFAASLSDKLDLEQLADDLVGVVSDTMQPAHVSLWLREAQPSDTTR